MRITVSYKPHLVHLIKPVEPDYQKMHDFEHQIQHSRPPYFGHNHLVNIRSTYLDGS